MPEKIQIIRPDGKTAPGLYFAPPAADAAPGLVVIQEWWGVNAQIQGVAERMAAAGYRVVIPDLYRGKVALDRAEAQHNMDGLDFADAATQDVRGAVQYLKDAGQRVGVMGFCMGGVLAVLAAMHVPEADAAVSWYGFPPPEAGDAATITTPLLCHFAEKDQSFPIAQAEALQKRLEAGAGVHACYRYDAGHAFANEDGANHDPAAAELAWQRSIDFLRRHLQQ
ncbi:MAG: dienelactone hydrolase family protein [Ottowia sp.]|nr:dienelactone hydrolase family protein [Ottowia sp.]